METGNKKSLNTRTLSLMITEKCNLNCVYCYEHNKTSHNMTFETAKKIIDAELKNEDPEKDVYVDIFGGEPFCNFPLIKDIYDYIMSFYNGKIRFFATTNGTLVHGEIQEWLKERKDYFTVGLSLDGTATAHNINRSNSFEKIDIPFFLENYPEQSVKMTVSTQSLPYFAESVKYLTELGFFVECNLAYMINWTSEIYRYELEKQLNDLIDYYISHPFAHRCGMLSFRIDILGRPRLKTEVIKKYCGTGIYMKCFDIKGDAYPCQLFTPTSAGDMAKKLGEINITDTFSTELLPQECRECYFQPICPTCYGSNYLSTGNLYLPDKERCELYKLIFRANAKLRALEWDKSLLKLSEDDEQALLRSIAHIQSMQ